MSKTSDLLAQERGVLPVNKGGTGGSDTASALANLGVKSAGQYEVIISASQPAAGANKLWFKPV